MCFPWRDIDLVGLKKTKSGVMVKYRVRALADPTAKVTWIISLLDELKFLMSRKLVLWCDNLSAKSLTLIQ